MTSLAHEVLQAMQNVDLDAENELDKKALDYLKQTAKLLAAKQKEIKNLERKTKSPSNKQLSKQLRFVSTKKKRNSKTSISKSTFHQRLEMREIILDENENVQLVVSSQFDSDHL